MNSKLRSKRVLIPAGLVVALAAGGVVWATTASADNVTGTERERVVAAATKAVPDGEPNRVETTWHRGEAYHVELRQPSGNVAEVALDDNLQVVSRDDEDGGHDDNGDDDGDDGDHGSAAGGATGGTSAGTGTGGGGGAMSHDSDDDDADDRALSASERSRASQAALAAVGGSGGQVTGVDADDDPGKAYDVEVTLPDGNRWHVDLDPSFAVAGKHQDR